MTARPTRSQKLILNLLQSLNRALSAQDIYIELRNRNQNMGLATIYRSLEGLKIAGSLQVRTLATGESLYSCMHEDQHHLTCVQCGRSITINECPVHDLENQLQDLHQFKIFYHTLEFFGLCDRCYLDQAAE